MVRRATTVTSLLLAVAATASFRPAFADPLDPGCVSPVDDLGSLVRELDRVLDSAGPTSGPAAAYGALGGYLHPSEVASKVRGLTAAQRRLLAGKLLGVALDPTLTGACEKDQVRYNAAMVLFELVKNATSDEERGYLLDCLIQATAAEKDPAAKRQMALNLDKLSTEGVLSDAQKAKVAPLVEEYLPTRPHYPTLFGEDGQKDVVNVVVHAGDETLQHGNYEGVFRGAGADVKKLPDGNLEITYKVTPDDPTGRYKPVTYKIRVVDEYKGSFRNLDVFSTMDKDDPAIEVYNFHSQYGSGLSKSIETGVAAPDSKKIFFLGSCKSKVNAGRIMAKYPHLGSVFTKDSEYFVDTPRALETLLSQLVNRPTWRQIDLAMSEGGLWNQDNYFYPDDRRTLAYTDSDFDGIPDLYDTGVNCGLSATAQSLDYAPATPVASHGKLNGEKLVYAVTAANGVLGYTRKVADLENRFFPDGWAPADPNGPMFSFTKVEERNGPYGNKVYVKVRTNAAYSHLHDTALAGAMLREFVAWDRSQEGRRALEEEDKILAYMLGVKLFDAWSGQSGSSAYGGYQKKFGLGRDLPLWEIASKIDHDRGVTQETIDYVKRKLHEPSPS